MKPIFRGLLTIASAVLSASAVLAAGLEPPKAVLVDRNNVNMANGQVTVSQPTVSIGGAMGLSHSVYVYANEFKRFTGKYEGFADNVELSTDPYYSPRNVLRVYDMDGTADFAYYNAAGTQELGSGYQRYTDYSYKPVGDERGILEFDQNFLYWTKADGTVSRYQRGANPAASSKAALVDVTYPNGLIVTIAFGGMSVVTNTGFQIKSIYENDHRDLRNCGQGCSKSDIPTLKNVSPYYTSYTSGWSNGNPKYIKGINNAVEYCEVGARDCMLTKKWPTATFNWAPGMPRTLSIGNTTVSVVDMTGRTTWYDFKAYDLAYESTQGGVVASGQTLNEYMSPRLVRVHSDGNDRDITYDYTNVYQTVGDASTWDIRLTTSGRVISANLLGAQSTGYSMNEPYYNDAINYAYGGTNGVSRVQVKGSALQGNPGAIYQAYTDEGLLWRDTNSPRNYPKRFENNNGPPEDYEYTRGNLTKIYYRKNLPDVTSVEAHFPASCTTATRKICNQADWIKDARGNVTYYSYHAPSGGVQTITYPANKNGNVAQTRYEYEQKFARYFRGGSSKVTSSNGIWLKTAERYCINSNYASGACAGSDEVVTRYEYNHDNLLMTGMTVTSPDGTTLRTCFKYDIYGNQIGKIAPNANLASCP